MTTAVETSVDWTEINDLAQRVGSNLARQWPGIDAEDMAQEAMLKLVEHPAILVGWPDNMSVIAAVMTKIGAAYAANERYEYVLRTSQYLYTPREIRGLLTHAYWDPTIRETDVPSGPDTKTQLLAWENICIALWDLDRAFEDLPVDDRFRLEKRYRDGEDYPTPAAKKACNRAIDRLTRLVNQRINRSESDV